MKVKFHEFFQHLEDSAEKNRQVSTVSCPDSDDKLPSPRTEAKALLRMVGRNGNGLDSLESLRTLIQVGETVRHMMFKNAPDKEEVKRMLEFRESVLAVFDELTAKQERVLEELALRQEKKVLRRSRFLSKRQSFQGESERLYGTSTESQTSTIKAVEQT